MSSVSVRCLPWLASAAAVLFAGPWFAPPAAAGLRMCALREGPRGPCTCKSDGDGPGQFTVVAKSRCKKVPDPAAPDASAAPDGSAAAAEAAGTPAAAPAAVLPPAAAPAAAPATAAAAALVAQASQGSRLDAIRARGAVKCGVNTGLAGFSAQTAAGTWTGLDADFCRAVAAAVFGDAGKAEFVPVETAARFDALKSGTIDLLSRNTTATMSRAIDLGLDFAGVVYFDGQGFMTGSERGLVSAQQLAGHTICVESGTTSETNMAYYFAAQKIVVETKTFKSHGELVKAFTSGACDAYTGDRSALYSDRAAFPDPSKFEILPEVISKEPLSPVVLKGDQEWSDIVRWTLAGLINAEEVGLDKAMAAGSAPLTGDALRLVDGAGTSGEKLRLSKGWLRAVIATGGHYGELFESNLGGQSPLGVNRGINALWSRGGILYAAPMW